MRTTQQDDASNIQPSPVKKTAINEGVNPDLTNGVLEIDGAGEGFSVHDTNQADYYDYAEEVITTKRPVSKLKTRSRPSARKSASDAYKERLKKRLEKEKAKLQLSELANKKKNFRSSGEETQTNAPRFKSRSRSSARSRSFETDVVFTELEQNEGRAAPEFGSRGSRPVRQRPSFRRNSPGRTSEPEVTERSSGFQPRRSFSSRNRFRSRTEAAPAAATTPRPTTRKPSNNDQRSGSTNDQDEEDFSYNKISIKKFNKFKRPDYRKTLFNKFLAKRPDIKIRLAKKKEEDDQTETEDQQDNEEDLAFPDDHESSPSALVPSIVDDENILQNIENEEIRYERLLTTLDVSTSYPAELSSQYLEVATIRSPYTFNIEDNEKSTRFITITKSLTKTLDISPSKSFTSAPSSSILPSPSLSSTPLFDTNSIPPPENILATTSTAYDNINLQGSSDIEFLAPITLTTSLHEATPPLKTVTETLSTVETMVKKSVLPVIIGEDITSLFTLSQTYSITRIVTAVKTVPPMDLFEFNPQQSFADFDTLFEGAGSENRESLLPGELEFSDQDNFGLEGPSIVKVAPPHEFLDDLDVIGTKFDFVDQMEKHNNPDLVQLKGSAPSLESSLRGGAGPEESERVLSSSSTASQAQPTPGLPDQGLSALGITPEQLLYLQLLQNPLAALGLGGLQPQVMRDFSGLWVISTSFISSQVITESSPVYKTEPVIETSVIKLFLGAKEYFTTLTNTQGVTVKTDYILATKTINSPTGLGGLTAGLEQPGLGLAALVPSYTVVTSPVTRDTLVTQTLTEQIRITFRNVPTLTTLTSTKVVSTQVTSFVTKTERVLPTANPLAGLLG